MLESRSRVTGVLLAASAVMAGSLATAGPASAKPARAEHPYIAVPVARVIDATANSLTVAAHANHATHYKVWVSTTRSAVYYNAIISPRSRAAHSAVEPDAMTVGNLPYTTNPYWFRVEAINGKHTRYSPIYETGVRPAVPTRISVGQNHNSQFLTWSADAAGEVVEQASNSSFSRGVKTVHIRQASTSYTPVDLNRGQTYWFRVKGDNYGTGSSWSAPAEITRDSHELNIKVTTFNILEANGDGTPEGGQRIAPWSQRRVVAARLIRDSGAGVVSIQEGSTFIGRHHMRQVVSLQKALGTRTWGLAHTEITYRHRYWMRTGCYILYRKAAFRTVGKGNHWNLGPKSYERWAAYQVLQSKSTGAKFLMVAPHLRVGQGRGYDNIRANETRSLLQQATTYNRNHGNLPIVFAGDYNSHIPSSTISYDGPGTIMRNWGLADAFNVARSATDTQWDSANLYQRKPPRTGLDIDHVFVTGGIGVDSWGQVIHLSHGRFVGVMASDHNPVVTELSIPF